MDALSRYHWSGNVRELQNVIERAVIISTGPALNVDVADLKFPKAGPPVEKPMSPKPRNGALQNVLEETERQQILKALKERDWIVAGPQGAAALLGELSTGETAQVMGLSVGAVKGRIFHGRKKLRRMLERYVESTRTYGTRALRTRRVVRDRSRAILELRPVC
jgi:hypothetical protein